MWACPHIGTDGCAAADEIDALGRARSAQADSGSQEREQGLLQLLYEMDGMKIDDKVLDLFLEANSVAILEDCGFAQASLRKCVLQMCLPKRVA